ncbi:MAG TPA: tetratricopeptide repeat protein [Candidatus Sulfotelmatobacter sp.]|nr:tetratricopeptide repeat protein [Candidatus Sulfotelmatobacter sp.]
MTLDTNSIVPHSKPALMFALCLLAWTAAARTASAQDSATRLRICESADQSCLQPNPNYASEWSFDGTTGVVTAPASQSSTKLTIESMSQDKIVIRRADPGRSATYSGTIHGNTVTGTVEWISSAHPDTPTAGSWSAIFQNLAPAAQSSAKTNTPELPQGLPQRLIECEGGGPCNGAWTFDGLSGTATWYTQSPIHAKLTVVRVDPDEITIRRTDLTDGNSAVYQGTRKGDTYSGAVIWSGPNQPGVSSGHWVASIPQTTCDAGANMSAADAMRVGQNALMFDLERAAFDCYLVAAQAGEPMAQTAVGLIYYQGRTREVPQDYKQAFLWLRKAADAGVYAAQRTVSDMYMLGQGTPKDRELSRFYGDKAAEQKRDREHQIERAEDRADRAADRAANAMTGFVMGAVFGALLF